MTALKEELRRLLATEGPVTVERFMRLALARYYATRDPFGAGGDFVTAPEISQMFGELLGLWAAEVWDLMGRPPSLRLVELGPGRGTLMGDALRAARVAPGFLEAIEVHLVETSPALRTRQEGLLAGAPAPVSWHADLAEVPAGPMILLANEFFDALPVRQYAFAEGAWRERLVGLDEGGGLAFGLAPAPETALTVPGQPGAVLEVPAAGLALMRGISERLAGQGGAALVIDYGHLRTGFGDTLQALANHAPADPLAEPGEADLTAHVDFDQLARAARGAGAAVHGPVTQGAFLRALGIEARAAQLKMRATPLQREAVAAAAARLTDEAAPTAMGALFKAMAIAHMSLAALPGFAAEP